MRKKTGIALIVSLCTVSLAACGEDASANTAPETVTQDAVAESTVQDSQPVSDTQTNVDISNYVYYSTAGDEFVAPKEKAIEGIPYELTEEEKNALIPESDIYVICATEIKDNEFIIEGEKLSFSVVESVSFNDEGRYDVGYLINSFDDEETALEVFDSVANSDDDSTEYKLDGRKLITISRVTSGNGAEIDNYVKQCIDMEYDYIVACDSGKLTGDLRDRTVALFNGEETTSAADNTTDETESNEQIAASDTGSDSNGSTTDSDNTGNAGSSTAAEDILANGVGKYTAANGDYIELIKRSDGTYYLKINLITSRSDMATDTFILSNPKNNSNGMLSYSNYTEFGFDCQVMVGNNTIDLNMGGDANFSALNETFTK